MSAFHIRQLMGLCLDFRANAFFRKYLDQQAVRYPAVYNMRFRHPAFKRLETRLDLGQHPACDREAG